MGETLADERPRKIGKAKAQGMLTIAGIVQNDVLRYHVDTPFRVLFVGRNLLVAR